MKPVAIVCGRIEDQTMRANNLEQLDPDPIPPPEDPLPLPPEPTPNPGGPTPGPTVINGPK